MTVININVATGEIVERELTEEEIAQKDIDIADALEREEQRQLIAARKSELLAKLGITEEEARLLLA